MWSCVCNFLIRKTPIIDSMVEKPIEGGFKPPFIYPFFMSVRNIYEHAFCTYNFGLEKSIFQQIK